MMKLESVGEVIAIRRLCLNDDEKNEVFVTIGKPQPFSDSPDYYCPFQINGLLGRESVFYAGGVDAIQAIQLAMKMIGALLYTSDEAKQGRLRWTGGSNGDLGFPSPDIS